jgi:hypothetical protein
MKTATKPNAVDEIYRFINPDMRTYIIPLFLGIGRTVALDIATERYVYEATYITEEKTRLVKQHGYDRVPHFPLDKLDKESK